MTYRRLLLARGLLLLGPALVVLACEPGRRCPELTAEVTARLLDETLVFIQANASEALADVEGPVRITLRGKDLPAPTVMQLFGRPIEFRRAPDYDFDFEETYGSPSHFHLHLVVDMEGCYGSVLTSQPDNPPFPLISDPPDYYFIGGIAFEWDGDSWEITTPLTGPMDIAPPPRAESS